MEYRKEDLMEAKKQILGVGENKDGNHNMQNKLNFVWRMRPIEKVY